MWMRRSFGILICQLNTGYVITYSTQCTTLLIHTTQPCIGISRIRRWRRANMLDLDPPIEVLAVLLKERKTQVKERAYVDELLS
jgi:hypothetical protein